jgi:hypothetical protein
MDKNRMNDRHNVPRPTAAQQVRPSGVAETGDGRFLDGFKERIRDFFKTADGLQRHVQPMQDVFTSLSKSDLPDDRKKLVAIKGHDQLKKAAEHAGFDFDEITFKVPSINWHMTIAKKGTKLHTTKS